MKKVIVILILSATTVMCRDKKENIPSTSVIHDTIFIPIQPLTDSFRYFLISYQFKTKDGESSGNGNSWFTTKAFPPKIEIDSFIHAGLKYKRDCYQPILITNIFEFKDAADYNSYLYQYNGSNKDIKNKKDCTKPLYRNKIRLIDDVGLNITSIDTIGFL